MKMNRKFNTPAQGILFYDGVCIFCIRIVHILEFFASIQKLFLNKKTILMLPYQHSDALFKKYSVNLNLVNQEIHLIDKRGQIYKGNQAIYRLGKYFPLLIPLTFIFKTQFGKYVYKLVSRNRHRIFGCTNSCYIANS